MILQLPPDLYASKLTRAGLNIPVTNMTMKHTPLLARLKYLLETGVYAVVLLLRDEVKPKRLYSQPESYDSIVYLLLGL